MKVVPLAVSVRSSCVMMKLAGDRLAKELDAVTRDNHRFPIVNNADAMFLRTAAELKPWLILQISASLYREDSVNCMPAEGFDTFIVFRPGKS
ncbi:MAG TPA: hypothetical protein VK654_09010 [Nitrospirota bacterium]|nr:hypothetical protein [Nitrospirota bacterium]